MPFDQSDFVVASPQVEAPVDPVLRCLVEARALHEDESHWAHTAGMGDCENTFCVIAAANHRRFLRPNRTAWTEIATYIGLALREMNYDDSVVFFSYDPRTTHSALLEMYDRAIAARRAEVE